MSNSRCNYEDNCGCLFIEDPGDYYDRYNGYDAWDFVETMPIWWIGNYPYKASNLENARKLHNLRKKINNLCENLMADSRWINSTNNRSYIDGVDVFLNLHSELSRIPRELPHPFYNISLNGHKTSVYLLSEMPKGTIFKGLNKPKMRYEDTRLPLVGLDKQWRALYRDIFLDLTLSNKELKKLIIHELAHSAANHVMYRPDNHHADFKWAEKLLMRYWVD